MWDSQPLSVLVIYIYISYIYLSQFLVDRNHVNYYKIMFLNSPFLGDHLRWPNLKYTLMGRNQV